MSETIHFHSEAGREERYRLLLLQLPSLLDPKAGRIANSANTVAALMEAFRFHWIGCYFVAKVEGIEVRQGEELVLGPFQGPVACTRIGYGKGVCGAAWKQAATIVVPDVDLFPGHIACDAASRSELVVPLLHGPRLIGVVDLDSPLPGRFDADDQADGGFLDVAHRAAKRMSMPDHTDARAHLHLFVQLDSNAARGDIQHVSITLPHGSFPIRPAQPGQTGTQISRFFPAIIHHTWDTVTQPPRTRSPFFSFFRRKDTRTVLDG